MAGWGFTAVIMILIAVYLEVTHDARTWKSSELQEIRKRSIESGMGDSVNDAPRYHRKYGYLYDPWYPALREKVKEDERNMKIYKALGYSPTEKCEQELEAEARAKGRIINWDKPQRIYDTRI